METSEPPSWRFRPRLAIWGCLLGLTAACFVEVVHVALGRNFHAVLPGLVYRGAQPTPGDLERAVRNHGIRTIVNLRGNCAPFDWFMEESRAAQRLGLSQEDLCFSSYRLPAVQEVRHLVEVFDRSEPPLLIHCRRGADRTGLAAAIYLLSQREVSMAEARRQLHWRFGHLAVGRTRHLTGFFDLYADWLVRQEREHSRAAFREWVADGYCPGGCRAVLKPIDFPAVVPRGKPRALRVRVRNTGVQAWEFKPENNAGVHLNYILTDSRHQLMVLERAGLYHRTVQPGESVELTIVLPALHEPGRYQLWADMVDEQQCWFYQAGSEPLDLDLEVR